MTHCDTVDTVSKLSDLRKAHQEATQTCTGNSNLHINYVSVQLCQMSVEIRQNSQVTTPEFPLTTPERESATETCLSMSQQGTPLLHHLSSSSALDGY